MICLALKLRKVSKRLQDLVIDSVADFPDFELIPTQPNVSKSPATKSKKKGEPERFKKITQSDVIQFFEKTENGNTKKKTVSELKVIHEYLVTMEDEARLVQFIPQDELNMYLQRFILSAKKKNGDEYEPGSLDAFIGSLERHLKGKDYPVGIKGDSREFIKTRDCLRKKSMELKSLGKGNKPNAAERLEDHHLDQMINSKTLGTANPRSLIHSKWLVCTSNFGMRTGKEASTLKWGDITLRSDTVHGDYLIYDTERQTKTRSGAEPRNIRTSRPKAWPTLETPEKCPITLYKLYKSKRPTEMLDPEAPFFLTVANEIPTEGQAWYKRVPMGIHKIYNIMKQMKSGAGIEASKIKPYSARKRLLQNMNDKNIPPQHQVQISGHRSINSLNSYAEMNMEQSKRYSDIIVNGGNRNTGSGHSKDHETQAPPPQPNVLAHDQFQLAQPKTPQFQYAQTPAQASAQFQYQQYRQAAVQPNLPMTPYFQHDQALTPYQYHNPQVPSGSAQFHYGHFGKPMHMQPEFHHAHPPLITGNTFNGPVTFQLHNTQSHNQTALSAICHPHASEIPVTDNSPDVGPRRWKRICSLSISDSD